jgi:hypothetical protein
MMVQGRAIRPATFATSMKGSQNVRNACREPMREPARGRFSSKTWIGLGCFLHHSWSSLSESFSTFAAVSGLAVSIVMR